MRTYTTTHTVYTFDELSDEAKQAVIEAQREREDFYFLSDDMQEELLQLLEAYKIKPVNVEVRYSLGYSQGDGASFTGDIEYKAWRATVGTNHWATHYSHSKTVSVTDMTSLKTDKEAPEATYEALQAIVEEIGDKLERYGYESIEGVTSDEAITEYLTDAGFEFTKYGQMV